MHHWLHLGMTARHTHACMTAPTSTCVSVFLFGQNYAKYEVSTFYEATLVAYPHKLHAQANSHSVDSSQTCFPLFLFNLFTQDSEHDAIRIPYFLEVTLTFYSS